MRLGWCAPLEEAGLLHRIGYDFIELPLAPMGLEEPDRLQASRQALRASPLPTSAFNLMFPRDFRIVGAEVNATYVQNYLARAGELLGEAQAEVVVMGSGWARNVPEGWDRLRAEQQILESLSWSADALKGTGCTLVIEPLNRRESNIINSVAEGVHFAEQVDRPEIRVLADFYHMDEENEPLDTLKVNAAWLAHIHLADTGRRNPGTGSYDYDTFLRYLREIGYRGMLSAECKIEDPEGDRRRSLAFLKQRLRAAA